MNQLAIANQNKDIEGKNKYIPIFIHYNIHIPFLASPFGPQKFPTSTMSPIQHKILMLESNFGTDERDDVNQPNVDIVEAQTVLNNANFLGFNVILWRLFIYRICKCYFVYFCGFFCLSTKIRIIMHVRAKYFKK